MIALLQRVSSAQVKVRERTVGAIDQGLVVFLAVEKADQLDDAKGLAERLLAYRVFADDAGRMNRSVADVGGGVLLIPQFTLTADTTRGLRPSFSRSAPPEQAQLLYNTVLSHLQEQHSGPLSSGVFAAHMQVHLINDGPATFLLHS